MLLLDVEDEGCLQATSGLGLELGSRDSGHHVLEALHITKELIRSFLLEAAGLTESSD